MATAEFCLLVELNLCAHVYMVDLRESLAAKEATFKSIIQTMSSAIGLSLRDRVYKAFAGI